MAGLGDRAAAKAIHRDASPGLRLRTEAHSPLPAPPDQKPLRLRLAPLYRIDTSRKPRAPTPQSPIPDTPKPSMRAPPPRPLLYVLPGQANARVIRQHPRARTRRAGGRARAGASQPAVFPVAAASAPPPTPSPSYWLHRAEEGAVRSQVPPSPLVQLRAARPPSIGYSRGPLHAAYSPLADTGDREILRGNGAGDPITSSTPPPNSLFPTELAGCAPPPLGAQTPSGGQAQRAERRPSAPGDRPERFPSDLLARGATPTFMGFWGPQVPLNGAGLGLGLAAAASSSGLFPARKSRPHLTLPIATAPGRS